MDPSQFNQVLVNLCVNARDAIGDVGWVRIATRNAVVEANRDTSDGRAVPGDYVLTTVSDNGCGIPKATLEHIFEPFFTTKGVGEGTGLGLSMVYGSISQNGGFIEVASETGKGTTFSIYLPRYVDDHAKERPTDITNLTVRRRIGILLLEDEPLMLRIVQRMLEAQGHTVFPARTPTEALSAATTYGESIDVLVTDVIMPEMNGRDLSERVAAVCPKIKVVFMSGYTANNLAPHGVFEQGMHFIEKPFTGAALIAKLREVLSESRESP
jgi:CheY-like chemotaxis protein